MCFDNVFLLRVGGVELLKVIAFAFFHADVEDSAVLRTACDGILKWKLEFCRREVSLVLEGVKVGKRRKTNCEEKVVILWTLFYLDVFSKVVVESEYI